MFDVILSYLPYMIVATFTPGPNNLMALYAVSTSGWKDGSKIILGIACGFSILILAIVLFCSEIARYAPALIKYLKYLGAAYIFWLAFHIAIATSKTSQTQERSINFKSGVLLALSNMKVILYLITLFTIYIIPSGAGIFAMLLHGIFILALSFVSWGLWGTAGGLLQKFLTRYYRPFNIAMGFVLFICGLRILM